ncbi:type II toxin-antitoxin system VapC family toxin [Candidatus Woesearchaeota archaeon]|nr:type II toxin-antitoxin system VapC family toxin [Candidatus Woesearchaeota archaeon]
MIYLDANFFIFFNFDNGKKGENARKLLREIVQGRYAVTSSLALDEVMWVIIKNNRSKELRDVIEGVYAVPNLSVKETGVEVPLIAVDIIERYGLKPRDAFHASVMKVIGTNSIASDDADFDKVNWIRRISF